MLRGFDVSHWQGAEDWSRWRDRYGLSFGAAKATQGVGYVDPRFEANWRGMAGAGLVRMAYDFATPDRDPRDDVAHLLDVVHSAPGGLAPTDLLVCDLERSRLSAAATADWACGWADEAHRQAPGFAAVVYSGGYMDLSAYRTLRDHFDAWWYPRYYGDRNAWPAAMTTRLPRPNVWGGPPLFWQFSDAFLADGEPHDANVFNGTLAELKAINPGARPAPPNTGGNDVTEAELRAAIRAELIDLLGLQADGTLATAWRSDGTTAAQPAGLKVAKVLAETRGKAVQLAAGAGLPVAPPPTP